MTCGKCRHHESAASFARGARSLVAGSRQHHVRDPVGWCMAAAAQPARAPRGAGMGLSRSILPPVSRRHLAIPVSRKPGGSPPAPGATCRPIPDQPAATVLRRWHVGGPIPPGRNHQTRPGGRAVGVQGCAGAARHHPSSRRPAPPDGRCGQSAAPGRPGADRPPECPQRADHRDRQQDVVRGVSTAHPSSPGAEPERKPCRSGFAGNRDVPAVPSDAIVQWRKVCRPAVFPGYISPEANGTRKRDQAVC